MHLLGIMLFLMYSGRSWSQEQTYVIAAPKLFRVGASEKVIIQAYGYEQEFPVTISIKSFPDKQTTYASGRIQLSRSNKFQGSVTLTIQPNDLSSRSPTNPVQYVYLEAVSSHFTREKKIPITYENGFLFIQTDKPIYTPDQSVKVRVYSLNEELRPARRSATLTFVDPEGTEVDFIKEDDFTGIVSFPDFKIPPHPKFGVWRIKAGYQKDFETSAEAKFQVKEYAMPSFSVTIEPEKNFISAQQFERFRITIRASYFYNKRVPSATVYVSFGIVRGSERTMLPRALQQIEMQDGVAECTFNSKSAVAEIHYNDLQQLDGSSLYIAASVLESTGGHSEESEFLGVQYILSPYKIELVATPLFVKPGHPFFIKVQVKDPLGMPAGNVPVILTANALNENMEETVLIEEGAESGRRQTSQNDGTARFVVNFPTDTKVLEFRVKTADPSLEEENQASKEYEAKSYVSLSGSYLYIDWASNHQTLRVGDSLALSVHPLSHYIDKIHHYSYLVMSKGKIIGYGSQERIKDTVYQSLNFQLTKEMVPSTRLLVYYIVTGEGAAELVADSIWINIEQKCGNNLQVQLSKSKNSFQPGEVVSLSMKTESSSFVALTATDKAIYGVAGMKKRPMERALLQLEKSDLGCGAGGGQNNVDVFRRAGLTFMTNANAEDSKEADDACSNAILRSARSVIDEQIIKLVSQFKKANMKKCCEDGIKAHPVMQTCSERASRVQPALCRNAFVHCCNYVENLRKNDTHKQLILARKQFEAILDLDPEVRSYFPESWLWEAHHVPRSKSLPVTLPDSLTTWEVQGVGISDQGICVADPLQVEVVKDFFLNVHIPYSVVRGEQIELRGSVYNYRSSRTRFCTKVTADKGICLFQGSRQGLRTRTFRHCLPYREVPESSVAIVTFKVLPLEIGLHTINFTLLSSYGRETLVKTLRVVPEGIRKELYEGHTLDPQGVYGTVSRQQEFRHRIPQNIVPKTRVQKTVSVKGLLLGDVITAALDPKGLHFLANLPRGSAETELMNIVPVFYVYDYLERTNSWDMLAPETVASRVNMKKRMKEGIISILSFRKSDFSYSMWKDGESSAWLTAFVLRVLGQVSRYMSVDQNSICNSLNWMIEDCQMSDGSFREISSYMPVKLQGMLSKEQKEKTLYLTAFSLIGFEKTIGICPLQRIEDAKNKAEEYLLKNFQSAQSTFSLALVNYALALAKSNQPGARSAFTALKNEALVKVGPPMVRFWKESSNKVDRTMPSQHSAKMVETTSYALLTALLRGDQAYANPIVRWLSEQQRYGGGFYSTQDTINALEALTEYSVLVQRLVLDMNIRVAYRSHGDFHQYRLTKQNYVGKVVEAPLDDDLEVRTGSNTGLAVVNVRTVYYKASTAEDACYFELKIDVKSPNEMNPEGHSYYPSSDGPRTLLACAKYRPDRREPRSASSHAVMDIALVSGLEANTEDLSILANSVDRLIANYEVREGHILVQVNSIPANEFLCIGFRVAEIFRVGMANPGTFTVYEYHTPDKQCSIFYNPYGEESLVRLCEGSECKCMEAECGRMQSRLDTSISVDSRSQVACHNNIAYVYKVRILSSKKEGSFVKYTATVLELYKRGEAFAQRNAEVTFIKKNSCTDVQLNPGEDYLIMGKEALKIGDGAEAKYQYPLDAATWIEWWPSDSSCGGSCENFVASMEEFAEDLFISGC